MTETSFRDRSWAHWTEPQTIDIEGLTTAYRRKGEGAPLVYLHGAGLTRAWLPVYEELAQSFDVVVPEHPGFGDTPMPGWLRGIDDLVLHYDALLEALDIQDAHLVGHSLGGWIASYLAIVYRHRFRSLSLVTPLGLRVAEAPMTDAFRMDKPIAMDTLLSGADPAKYIEYFDQDSELEDMIQAYGEAITFARLFWNPRYDTRLDRRLERICIPTQVIAADDDRLLPRPHPERWAGLIPGAELVEIHGDADEPTGHLLIVQQPERLAEAIASHARASDA